MLATSASGISLLVNAPLLFSDRLQLLERLNDEFGEFIELPSLGTSKRFIAYHPDHVEYVLGQNARNYCKGRTFAATTEFAGEGLTTAEGVGWKEQRQFLNPHFHKNAVVEMSAKMLEVIDENISNWQSDFAGSPFNLALEFRLLSLSIALQCLFGMKLERAESIAVIRAMQKVLVHATTKGILPFGAAVLNYLPTSRSYQGSVTRLRELAQRIIDNAKFDRQFFAMLVADAQEAIPGLTQQKVIDNIVTFLIGATDTTANTMGWVVYSLYKHPQFLELIEEEIAKAVNSDSYDLLTRTVKETLRLYPQNWLMSRDAISDDCIGGYEVPAGSTIYLAVYTIHRRPDLWEDPLSFNPDRFIDKPGIPGHAYSYLPFGAGPRKCIGMHFSMNVLNLTFASLFSRCRFVINNLGALRPYATWSLWTRPDIVAQIIE